MTPDKIKELALDIYETVRDLTFDEAESDARDLDHKLATDRNVSNEERGNLVREAYYDYIDGQDQHSPKGEFERRFPEFS